MKKTYQSPHIKTMSMEPAELLAATLTNVEGKSEDTTIFGYGGGGNSPARGSGNNIWDDSDNDSDWDGL